MKLNTIVVDDSSIQRITIAKLISDHPHLRFNGDFANALEAKNHIANNEVDLIFLDVEMPHINGFDLLDGLKSKPQIIFITSKADYAVKAFDYSATDFIQKPIKKDRFSQAVKKAVEMYQLRNEQVIDESGPYIVIKSNLKKVKLYISRVKYIKAYGDYIKVVTYDDEYMVLTTMKKFEADLPKEHFLRIHKTYIVNIDKIERFNSRSIEIDGEIFPLSRTKKEEIISSLNSLQ
jgi:two-component system, LytTR family, response regulator